MSLVIQLIQLKNTMRFYSAVPIMQMTGNKGIGGRYEEKENFSCCYPIIKCCGQF